MADILKNLNIEPAVLVLIIVAVVCIVIGCVLFMKLMAGSKEKEEKKQSVVDADYVDNFKNCFANTGTIEGTLEQLADIYTSNKFMHKLITDAMGYINDDFGDYETALEMINVEKDETIKNIHEYAVKKATEAEADNKENHEKSEEGPAGADKEEDYDDMAGEEYEAEPEETVESWEDGTAEGMDGPDDEDSTDEYAVDKKPDDTDFEIDFDKDDGDSDMDDYKI